MISDNKLNLPSTSEETSTSTAATSHGKTIVFVDTTLTNWTSLLKDLPTNSEIHTLDPLQNGIQQIADALRTESQVAAVHIVSHGGEGFLVLGNTMLSSYNLASYETSMATIQNALGENADILLYGCDVAKGDTGAEFVRQFRAMTGADIAASTNDTGSGGDWVLEYKSGAIEALAIASTDYQYDLATIKVTNLNDSGTGSLRDAIANATGDGGADTIVFDPALFASGAATLTLTTGELDVDAPDNGDHLTIIGPGEKLLTISGNNSSRIFAGTGATQNTSSLSLSGMTLTNAKGQVGDSGFGGGAISFQYSGSLTLDHVIVTNSTSSTNTGGLSFYKGSLTISNSTFSNNTSTAQYSAGDGVAIYAHASQISINNTTISGNSNSEGRFGGGISIYTENSATLSNVTIANNSIGKSGDLAGGGGGISIGGPGVTTITNSTIVGNAFNGGDGFNGGGGGLYLRTNAASVVLKNTIIANNTSTNNQTIDTDVFIGNNAELSGSNNLITSTIGTDSSATNSLTGTITSLGSALGSLAFNGGVVQTISITTGSNAINAGTSTGAPSHDARGLGRGSSIDIGAYEFNDDNTFQFSGTLSPNNGAVDVPINQNFSMDFGKTVTAVASKNIVIYRQSDNAVLETIAANDVAKVSFSNGLASNSVVTINPTSNLSSQTNYYIRVDNGAFIDSGSNSFSGISSNSVWTFQSVVAPPTVTNVSASSSNGNYNAGDIISIEVTFSAAVTVDTTGGVPRLLLETGSTDRSATYTSGSGSATLVFQYTVQAGDTAADLDYVATTSLTLNSGTIKQTSDAADAVLTLPSPGTAGSLANNKNIAIDTAAPHVTISLSDTNLKAGETATVTFSFDEVVSGFNNADVTSIPNGSLGLASTSNGGLTYTATFTPDTDVEDTSNMITVNNTGYTDLAGNAGTGSTNSGNFNIDTARPTVTISLDDTNLTAGETTTATFTFSEKVSGFDIADVTSVGSGSLGSISTSDNIIYTATFTPTADTTNANNVITVDQSGVKDMAGNDGVGSSNSGKYSVATAGPTLTIDVDATSLKIGDTTTVTFTFSEAVSGLTSDDITVENGSLGALNTSDGITWTATLTPNTEVEDSSNQISVANSGVLSVATGNAGVGTTTSNTYAIDTTRPTLIISMDDDGITANENPTVTFTFSEEVTDFTDADISVANGTLGTLTTSDHITFTAVFTPTAETTDTSNIISVDNTGIKDLAGNEGKGTSDSPNYAVTTVRPTVNISIEDTALKIGETTKVTFTFSEAVNGFANWGIAVSNGTLSTVGSVDGGVTWTATLTPDADTEETSNVIRVNNSSYISSASGNPGFGSSDSGNYKIDTLRPTASILVSDTALSAGETSLVTITFNEAVSGFDQDDLTVTGGILGKLSSTDGDITWTASFTPTADSTSKSNLITLDNTGVADLAGNKGNGNTDSNSFAVDTARPTVNISIDKSSLKLGDTAEVTFSFSEAVKDFDNTDISIAHGSLSKVSSSDGGQTWVATLTPDDDVEDDTNQISVDNSAYTDLQDNAGIGSTDSANYLIDSLRPTVSISFDDADLAIGESATVSFTFSEAVTGFDSKALTIDNATISNPATKDGGVTWTATLTPDLNVTASGNVISLDNSMIFDAAGNSGSGTTDSAQYSIDSERPTASIVVADTNLLAGETSLVTITFSEAVTDFTNDDLTIDNGILSSLSSVDSGVTWTATLTPSVNTKAASNLISLDNAGIKDIAGNAGAGTTESNTFAIDTQRPTVTISVDDEQLHIGESSKVSFTFSEAVTGFDNKDITVDNGILTDVATEDGGITWTATFTPSSNIEDSSNLVSVDNTGFNNASGNAGVGSSQSNNYEIDTERPSLATGISISNTALKVGETADITFTFTEAIKGFTTADLTVDHGAITKLSSADGGTTWTAILTPTAAIESTKNLISLDYSKITDVAGNAGTGSVDSGNYKIDTLQPTSTVSISDAALIEGETATLTIKFTEAVTGFTTADINVEHATISALSSADSGITWTATYTPDVGIQDAINVISIDNTGVLDLAGNSGYGKNQSSNFAVDTLLPDATISFSDTELGVGDTAVVTFNFNERVTGFSNANLTVPNGILSAVSSSDGGQTWTATFTPTFGIDDNTNTLELDLHGISDLAGNAAKGFVDSNNFIINTVNTDPIISGTVSNQVTKDTSNLAPFANVVITDPDPGAVEFVTVTLDNAAKGKFTTASLAASGFSTSDGGISYTHAAASPAQMQAALRALIFQPSQGRVAIGDSETTTFTVTVDDGIASDTDNLTTVQSTAVNAAPTKIVLSNSRVTQDAGDGALVGTLSTNDINPGDQHSYTIVAGSENSRWFNIINNELHITHPTVLDAGDYEITVRSTDAGGLNIVQALTVKVRDSFAPEISSYRVTPVEGRQDQLIYTIVFTESVSGVDLSDFSLKLDGEIGANLSDCIAVDASTYQIVVSDIVGNGRIQVNLNPEHGIKDVGNRALLGGANGPTFNVKQDTDQGAILDEANVPNRYGDGTGDGNGDGIQDIEQDAVSSLIWSQQDDIDPTYLTVWNDQNL
ncbi:Ig-like domain-containing protein, partial [Undibacterium fentianense]